jgi:hypothetical protein
MSGSLGGKRRDQGREFSLARQPSRCGPKGRNKGWADGGEGEVKERDGQFLAPLEASRLG